jgi:UDP-N-acetylglucosamine transferase subunit ALG13
LGERDLIFASVGSMLPFDRFVRAIDEWARDNPQTEVFIQIGGGSYLPQYAPFERIVTMAEYRQKLMECDLFVAHVGMGSILQGFEAGKQMLLFPRDFSLGEHTTDHQMHTVARFSSRPGLRIVHSIDSLKAEITNLLANPLPQGEGFSTDASPELLRSVSNYLTRIQE